MTAPQTLPVAPEIDPETTEENKPMTRTIRYHTAHEPYLAAVADALRQDGIAVEDYSAEPDDPRCGSVTIAAQPSSRRFGDHLLVLVWHEETGWKRGTEDPDGHGQLRTLSDSPVDLLAAPTEIATWVRAVLAGTDNDQPLIGRGGYYRYFDDEDKGFEARLRAYWPAGAMP